MSNQFSVSNGKLSFNIITEDVHWFTQTSENNEWAIEKGQSIETGNIGYTRRRKTKQKHNTICVGHHYVQANISHTELRM